MFNSLDARRTLGRPDPKRLLARIGMGFITPPHVLNINGNNDVDQRNIGVSRDFTNLNPFITDRWQVGSSGLTTQTVAAQQIASTIPGFSKSLRISTGGTGAAPASGAFCTVNTYLEGLDVASLMWGTASAVPITVSFWVKPSVSGRTSVSIRNQNTSRSYVAPFDFTAGVPRLIVLKIPGDKGGTWVTDTSTTMQLAIDMGCGSSLSTTPGTWQAGNFNGLTNGTKLIATNGVTFEITGLTITPGNVPASPVIRPYSEIFEACLRYGYVWRASTAFSVVGNGGFVPNGGADYIMHPLPTRMRRAPSVGFSGTFGLVMAADGQNVIAGALSVRVATPSICWFSASSGGGFSGAAGAVIILTSYNDATASILFEAEN